MSDSVEKPTLPSIECLLQSRPADKRQNIRHRSTHSVSSLPQDLQNLSLCGPMREDETPRCSLTTTASTAPSGWPSWMGATPLMVPRHQVTIPSRRTGASHARSVSDIAAPLLKPADVSDRPMTLDTAFPHPVRPRHLPSHRRAASANTVDFMVHPPFRHESRAHSNSPPESRLRTPPQEHEDDKDELQQRDSLGRYMCPYCKKGFSRPSSLRIHTYSHTGEKPFVCSEEGCGRRFSVQSNMRRHLRVHRMGRAAGAKQH